MALSEILTSEKTILKEKVKLRGDGNMGYTTV
jgi:hypothetical protein